MLGECELVPGVCEGVLTVSDARRDIVCYFYRKYAS